VRASRRCRRCWWRSSAAAGRPRRLSRWMAFTSTTRCLKHAERLPERARPLPLMPMATQCCSNACARRRPRGGGSGLRPRARPGASRGRIIAPEHRFLIAEGNYLLLDEEPWVHLADMFDLTVMLKADPGELRRRLVDRWLAHGLDPDQALARALSNDIPMLNWWSGTPARRTSRSPADPVPQAGNLQGLAHLSRGTVTLPLSGEPVSLLRPESALGDPNRARRLCRRRFTACSPVSGPWAQNAAPAA
jgi:hypothetical protein